MSRAKRGVRAVGLGATMVTCILSQALATSAPSERANEVSECVSFDEEQDDEGMDFHIRSECERSLQCEMSWIIRCAEEPGAPEGVTFTLAPGAVTTQRASAEHCEQGWAVENVSWACRTRE